MVTGNDTAAPARGWARGLVELNPDAEPLALVASVAAEVASHLAVGSAEIDPVGGEPRRPNHPVEPLEPGELVVDVAPPGGWADPWLPGLVHEQAVSGEDRSARGAWYTPPSVVRGLLRLATPGTSAPRFIADPTCGGGAFLLAALDRLVELGLTPADATDRVAGLDIDAGAAQVSRWSVWLWALANGVSVDPDGVDVSVGDALAALPAHWPGSAVVVGNPPFATPLRTGAVPPEVAAFREGREDLLGPYTDLAAMHLLSAVEKSSAGSTVVLVQPQSVLAGRDSGPLRDHFDRAAPIHGLWAAREPLFDAGVRACAAVLKPGASVPDRVVLASGPDVVVRGDEPHRAGSWAGFAARALGAPSLPGRLAESVAAEPSESSSRSSTALAPDRLGSMVTATAGFRDEYYGLVAACAEWEGREGAEPNRLLTVGSVEPLATKWGAAGTRFGRRTWSRPWVDVDRLNRKVRGWSDRQLQPKVVLATQSRILEPVIDRDGKLLPATPLIAVHGGSDDLDLVAAVLLAPPVVAWAWQRWFGAALAVDALKLAARQVLEVPLPDDRSAWHRAASLIAESNTTSVADGWAVSCEVAALMNEAYRAERDVFDWWLRRANRSSPESTN